MMHRDCSREVYGTPVRIELYPDRLEIVNPGGLFGPLTVKTLGAGGITQSRNQFLSRILEDVPYIDIDGTVGKVVENRGTGYALIQDSLTRALPDPPTVLSSLDEFRIIFHHRKMTEQEDRDYTRSNVEEGIGFDSVLMSSKSAFNIQKGEHILTFCILRNITMALQCFALQRLNYV